MDIEEVAIVRRALLEDGTERIIYEELDQTNEENRSTNVGFFAVESFKHLKPNKQLRKTRAPVRKAAVETKLNDVEVEYLLLEVQSRPPLWNFENSLERRYSKSINLLWEEVSAAMNRRLSAEEAKKKFKSIRDTHRKIIAAEYRASGSARVDTKNKWKYYGFCEFLRDTCLMKLTSCNVTEDVDEEERTIQQESPHDNMDESNDESSSANTPSHKRPRKRTKESMEADVNPLLRIANKICRESPPLVLPSPPTIDHVDNFLAGIGHEIRKLPKEQHFDVILEIMNLVRSKQHLNEFDKN